MQERYVDLTGDELVIGTLKELRPNVSVPANLNAQILSDINLYKVIDRISYDRATQRLTALENPIVDNENRTYTTVEATDLPDATKIELIRAKKLESIKSTKRSLQEGLLVFANNTFQINETSRNTLNNAITLNGHTTNSHGGTWTDVNNTPRAMDDDKLVEFGLAVGEFFRNVHVTKLTFEYQINNANTLAAIESIDVTSGWPNNGIVSI